ncbi:unnamed protein product [Rhizophagus irregularis]|uniref:Uncharacterized protein n=1 Tax=Rhizophagus irregularis TaxID=588596 RepID=A0A915YR31_9GLOM|nr:unnamed protein product [Rhizophagus irregularis]
MYLFLTGDSSALTIEKDNNRVSYLMQKVEILAEIELFYLLPHQRRWQAWFPYMIVSKLSKEQSPQIEKIDEIKEIEVQPNNQK